MQVFGAGDPQPLDAWDQERFPILKHVLDVWARDTDLGDRLAFRIMREAFVALRAGREIRSELSWMAGVALRGRAEILIREHPIGDALAADVRAPQGEPIDDLIRREECEHVRRLVANLPTKHRLALTLRYLLGRTEAEVASYLKEHFRVGTERTRQILKEGRDMVKTGLAGRYPRVAHQRRYGARGKSQKFLPPSPRFRNYMG